MPTIGVVDDRGGERSKLVRGIEVSNQLPDAWGIADIAPLSELSEYSGWIAENDVAVLLVDERLDEHAADGEAADYTGHELVAYLRQNYSEEFPMFIVTAYPPDRDLQENVWNLEDLILRRDFVKDVSKIVPKLLRSGQRFFEVHQHQLSRAEELSKKVAIGEATDDDIAELDALRAYITRPFQDSISSRREWIEIFDKKIADFEKLEAEFKELIKPDVDADP
jgi:hypothetical protein